MWQVFQKVASCIQHASAMAYDGKQLSESYPHVVGTGMPLQVLPGRVKKTPQVIFPPLPKVAPHPKVVPPKVIVIPPLPARRPEAKKMPRAPIGPPPAHLIKKEQTQVEVIEEDMQCVISLIWTVSTLWMMCMYTKFMAACTSTFLARDIIQYIRNLITWSCKCHLAN